MCIAVIKKSGNPTYKFFVAVVRDEKKGKSHLLPAFHWPQYPDVCGFLDLDTKGSWLAFNEYVFAVVLNREMTSSNLKLSRCDLVLRSVTGSKNVNDSMFVLESLETSNYNPFNIILIDRSNVRWGTNVINGLQQPIRFENLNDTLIIINRSFPNDMNEQRVAANFEALRSVGDPNPDLDDWQKWEEMFNSWSDVYGPENEVSFLLNSTHWMSLSCDFFAIPSDDARFVIWKPLAIN